MPASTPGALTRADAASPTRTGPSPAGRACGRGSSRGATRGTPVAFRAVGAAGTGRGVAGRRRPTTGL